MRISRKVSLAMALVLMMAVLPAGSAAGASSTVTLQAADLIEMGTEESVCYYHGSNLPCPHCACFMAMAEAQGGVQLVRADSDGYYMLGYLQEGYLEPFDEMDVLVINLFVLKTDFSGKVLWFTPVRALSGETSYPGDLLTTGDGGCLLVQKRYVYEEDLLYVEAARIDASGRVAWQNNLTPMKEEGAPAVNVGHDSWLFPNDDGSYYVSWNMLNGEEWATLDTDGSILSSGSQPQQTQPDTYKSPELQASWGEYSVTVDAPITKIIMHLELPGTDESPNPPGMIPVLVDGVPVAFPDVLPFVNTDNRTLVPLRPVLEAMGITVTWSGESNQALLSNGATNVIFTLNSSTYMVNQELKEMDTVPVVYEQRIMLPIRYAAEAFGATVDWQNDSVLIITQ